MTAAKLLIRDLAQVATPAGRGAPLRRSALRKVEVLEDAFVLCSGATIEAVGRMQELPSIAGDVEEFDGRGLSAIPGLVDCHTHASFAGDRVAEFSLRAGGASYEELHAAGGGWVRLVGPLCVLGYLGMYAWRLPVTYQHGRYVIPVMPVFFLWGMVGLVGWSQPAWREPKKRVVARAWVLTCIAILLAFWISGGRAYAQDVAVIESEMVQTARWIAENTRSDALIAAHDIGALGYFGQRELLDLAGLVSPEVIPVIRDEAALMDYLDLRQADYLMTFPGWYPILSRQGNLVYSTGAAYSLALSGENMAVFRWNPP